ncbi:MAG: DUF418 domain-containing protein [Neobacillus sp.]
MSSIEGNKRIDLLDYLRGFALLGIILVNILPLLEVKLPAPVSLDASYQRFLFLFVEGRFYTLFSFLFGVGFYLFISRAIAKGRNGYFLFFRRILILFIFGLIHVQFHQGEALTVYAVVGLLLLPCFKVRRRINLGIGLLLLFAFSILASKLFMVIPLMLLGIAAGQYQVFERVAEKLKKVKIFTLIVLILGVWSLNYQYQLVPSMPFGFFAGGVGEDTYMFLSMGIMIGPIVSALYVGILILLLQFPLVQKILSPLKSYGRMALTNYLSQTILIYLAGHIFQLFGQITYLQSLFVCLVIYALQLIFSVMWLRYFHFGPMEWLWRLLTYLKAPPMKIQLKASDAYKP